MNCRCGGPSTNVTSSTLETSSDVKIDSLQAKYEGVANLLHITVMFMVFWCMNTIFTETF